MESIGRDNIKTSTYVVEQQLKDNNKFRPLMIIGFVFVILFLTVAYASLAINFGIKIHEPRQIKGDDIIIPDDPPEPVIPDIPPPVLNWRIRFQNLVEYAGSVEAETPAYIDTKRENINFKVRLTTPGDYYKFKADIVNDGDYNAVIYYVTNIELSPDQAKYLDFTITYDDGTEIKKGDELRKGTKKTIIVSLVFKEDIDPDDLPQKDEVVDIKYSIDYVEK